MIFTENEYNIKNGEIKGTKIPKGETYPQRINYHDEARDLTQSIIRKESYRFKNSKIHSTIKSTTLKITFIDETSNLQNPSYETDIYNCLDGVFDGTKNYLIVSLCEPSQPTGKISSIDCRVQLIKSLKMD